MKTCNNCNREANSDACFCQYCGAKLEEIYDIDNNNSNFEDTNLDTINIEEENQNVIYVEPLNTFEKTFDNIDNINEDTIIIETETITSTLETKEDDKKLIITQIAIISLIVLIVGVIVNYVLKFNDDFEDEYSKGNFVNLNINDVPTIEIEIEEEDTLFNIVGSTLVEFKADHMLTIIPDNVKSIGANAFINAPDLYKITIPNTVTHIDPEAFNGCYKLKEFEFIGTPSNDMLEMIANLNIFKDFIIEGTTLVGYRGLSTDISIPNFITKIDDGYRDNDENVGVFSNRYALNSIEIPDSVTYIGSNAFASCTNLVSITLSNNLEYLGENAFLGCESLVDVILPNSLSYIGESAFAECKTLKNIEIPPHVTSLYNDTFRNCVELENIELGNIFEISDNVFFNCQKLEIVKISPKVTKIGTTPFLNTPWFDTLSGEFNVVGDGVLIKYNGDGVNVQIPDLVKHISNVFYAYDNLQTVVLPDTIETINKNSFANRSNLTSINIPDSVLEIGDSAFENCTSLIDISIPDTVQLIGENVFNNTLWFDNLDQEYNVFGVNNLIKYNFTTPNTTIPDGITSITNKMYFNIKDLRSVNIPETITSIGDESFFGCSNLVDIVIPSSVTSIGYNAFNGCTSLTEITLLDSINFIGDYSFVDTSIEKIFVVENSYAHSWVIENLSSDIVVEFI